MPLCLPWGWRGRQCDRGRPGRKRRARRGPQSLGTLIVGDGLYRCNCGKMGCLETYSSATAVIWLAKKRIEEGCETEILSMAGSDPEAVNAEMVINAAKTATRWASNALSRWQTIWPLRFQTLWTFWTLRSAFWAAE